MQVSENLTAHRSTVDWMERTGSNLMCSDRCGLGTNMLLGFRHLDVT